MLTLAVSLLSALCTGSPLLYLEGPEYAWPQEGIKQRGAHYCNDHVVQRLRPHSQVVGQILHQLALYTIYSRQAETWQDHLHRD